MSLTQEQKEALFGDEAFKENTADDPFATEMYEDYKKRLEDLYLMVYQLNPIDMTTEAHDIYAIMEGVFQATLPGTPDVLLIPRERGFTWIETMFTTFMATHKYPTVLALAKYLRQKEISALMAEKNVTMEKFLEDLPPLIRILSGDDVESIFKKAEDMKREMLTLIVDHLHRLVALMTDEEGNSFYPWDILTMTTLYPAE